MDFLKLEILFLILWNTPSTNSQRNDLLYAPVNDICKKCVCLTREDEDHKMHHVLMCSAKNLKHILPRWPEEFGTDHKGREIIVTFSGNTVSMLQQIPPTNGTLSFSCRHCSIKEIQAPVFIDSPNILQLDLSWNDLTGDVLTPDVFRGPYNLNNYEPIALQDLDLSHNKITSLDRRIFEHTPYLKKLNLAYNNLSSFDKATTEAISSAINLEILDLSYNELETITFDTIQPLTKVLELNLAGNKFKTVPESLAILGTTLKSLNLAENPIGIFNENSFLGMRVLKHLNISWMPELEVIDYGAFKRLTMLENLICSYNEKLTKFDLTSLNTSPNLKVLDISHNKLKVLLKSIDIAEQNVALFWEKLPFIYLNGNPWNCDCDLIKTLENYINSTLEKDFQPRCTTPYNLSGKFLSELLIENLCQSPVPRKLKIPIHDPPSFLRPRSIALSIVAIAGIVATGIIIGFIIVFVKRRLKKTDTIFNTPIRYTIVRNSVTSLE